MHLFRLFAGKDHWASRRRRGLYGFIVLAALAAFGLPSASSRADGMTEGWTKIVSGGFTDRNNGYVPAQIEFKGYLYLSTAANEAGFMFSKSHKAGGDIWRSEDGIKWEQIGKPGLGNPHNSSFNFVVFRQKLYAIANNLNDHGIEIWVSEDGIDFTRIENGGFGDPQNNWANGFVFNDRLVLGVSGSAKGAQIWTSDDGLSFQPVVADGLGDSGNSGVSIVQELPVLDGKLYIGTSNPASGGEIWRTGDGLRWERVADDGLERSSNTSLTPFVVFNGQLYAVGISSGSLDKLKGLEIYRSVDGSSWQKVVSDGFSQGKERNVSGALQVFKGRLYLTADTMDPRLLMPGHPGERMAPRGFQLWVSDDGENWQQTGKDGFGLASTLYASMNVIGSAAFLCVFDYHKGSQLLRSDDGEKWEPIFKEPEPSFYSEGGGVIDFKDHLIWFDHDLGKGFEAWRADAALGK
jgi:hypothetical protein